MKKKFKLVSMLSCIALFLLLDSVALASAGSSRGANDPTIMPIGRRPFTPAWARP